MSEADRALCFVVLGAIVEEVRQFIASTRHGVWSVPQEGTTDGTGSPSQGSPLSLCSR